MDSKEKEKRLRNLRANMNEAAVRIRRYTVDPRLCEPRAKEGPAHRKANVWTALPPEIATKLRQSTELAWTTWLGLHVRIENLPADIKDDDLIGLEREYLQIDHDVDIIQRELISEDTYQTGSVTVRWLVVAMVITAAMYVFLHIIHPPEFISWDFEPWSEWGPLKYGEVMFWGMFGCLCYLLFTASYYLLRRDFDLWYKNWYVAVFVRSPFMTLILMMGVLEFSEWYGEDKSWIRNYILEEGNKFYFIVFVSFCLGLGSDTASSITRDLSNGVCEFVSRAASKISSKLKSAISDTSTPTQH